MSNSFNPNSIITASQFMEDLVGLYGTYWTDPTDSEGEIISYSFDSEHTTDLVRRTGWGQAQLRVKGLDNYDVATSQLVEREHLNTVIAQVNAGLWHIDNENILLDARPLSENQSNLITSSEFESVRNKIITSIIPQKDICIDDIDLMLTASALSSDGEVWSQDLYSINKFVFNDYNHARHFFNAGGLLTLQLDMTDTNSSYNMVWDRIFESIGWVGISGTDTHSYNGSNNNGANIGVNRGFYSISDEWTTLFEAAGATLLDVSNTDNVYAYAYAYVYSEYNSRRVIVEARGVEANDSFEIQTRVSLIEDIDDTYPITGTITLFSGYKQPIGSPDYVNNPPPQDKVQNFVGTPGSTQYGFTDIPVPTIQQIVEWTPDDLVSGRQVDWDATDPGTNWISTSTGQNRFKSLV